MTPKQMVEGSRLVVTAEGGLDIVGSDPEHGPTVTALGPAGNLEQVPLAWLTEEVPVEGGGTVRVPVHAGAGPVAAEVRAAREKAADIVAKHRAQCIARVKQERAAARALVLAAEAEAYSARVHGFGEAWVHLPEGRDLVGRGWDPPKLVETAAGWIVGGCTTVVCMLSGAVAVFVAPQAIGWWVFGAFVLAVGQVIVVAVADTTRTKRGLQWWVPLKDSQGRIKVRRRPTPAGGEAVGGLEVWASKGHRKAWIPASEFCFLAEDEDAQEEGG